VGDVADLLASTRSVLVVDWPSRDVPESLARAGYDVVVSGGAEPDNYSVYETVGRDVVVRFLGRRPDRVVEAAGLRYVDDVFIVDAVSDRP
jgi:hypothetical protein